MTDASQLSPKELQEAFQQFNLASQQLSEQFNSLQAQVVHLSSELAASNAALQAQLREKETLAQRVALLLAVLPAGVLELDAHGVITAANWAAEQFLQPDLPGKTWQSLEKTMLVPTNIPGEYELQKNAGMSSGRARLSIQHTPLPEARGSLILLTDLSSHFRLQQQLAQHKKLAAMGEMAAGLAHQLRTPLATALLYVGHLNKPVLPDVQRLKFADKAKSRLIYLEGLIADMLSFVRGDAGEKTAFHIHEWVGEAIQSILPVAEEKQVAIRLTGDAGLQAAVMGHKKGLQGALLNLLENALSFTPAGGEILVIVQLQAGSLQIKVIDQGPGISTDIADKVFTPFFTTRHEGTGLGLAIVKNMVELHGGEIALQNRHDQSGCEARIILPLSVQ
ncbi:HAMP domain-containing histidine kinase [Leeia sp. TBRC 13508]|uniref:histidine kinase n=1 Tax=Leeia speluncae TaxID=2884804 RepID=A0ABS8DAU9_9NEIS|nr:HAMP domain-containing sensor histidine kinase [Leeia speluncae]MCB6185347.1 HAMP domain-containing histidine kinase [Leeia speluncae]